MSGGSSGSNDCFLDEDDLAEIRERFQELTKEKELLRDSKSQSFDLIRRLDFHVKAISESREEDKKRIADLERELCNCSQEIDYLQDQLNIRDSELSYSESRVEKLEESILSLSLEYECEIESSRLESISLEQNLLETKKLLEEKAQENSMLNELVQDIEARYLDADKAIESLVKENNDLRKNQLHESLREANKQAFSEPDKDTSTNGTVLGPPFSKLAIPRASDADLRSKMAGMSRQIDDYELLVRRLKEDLREEKLKAKEDAEDLAQEMAELRYQLTLMLEEECKRRASVEQISLHRIAELEAQDYNDALSDLSNLLGELKEMAVDMESEIDRQNKSLDHIDIDELNFRMKSDNLCTRRLRGK